MSLAIAALVAWGAFAFGAVYPWGYLPLGIGSLAVGGAALIANRRRIAVGPTCAATLLVAAAIGLQLLPLRTPTLMRVSQAADRILTATDVPYAVGQAAHPLSVNVAATVFAIGVLTLMTLWVGAIALSFNRADALQQFVRGVIVIGSALAIVGLAQQATFNGKLLWFWTPRYYVTNAFGPFVNRNHFAGWMLLAMGLSIGYLFGRIIKVRGARTATWRDRIIWLGSREAVPVILISAAVALMACSLVWTMSRSGIAATGVAVAILLAAAVRRSHHGMLRMVLAGYLLLTVIGVGAWRGGDRLVDWYGNTTTLEWRVQLWKDTLPALEDFWLTGSGLNTYSTVMLVYPHTDSTVQPREAHNDYLELAVDGGLLVCLPGLLLLIVIGRQIAKRLKQEQSEMTWWIRMGAVAAICGLGVQELTDFSLQIPGVALLFATCLGIALHRPAPVQSRRHHRSMQRETVTI